MKLGLQIPRFHWPGSPGNLGEKLAEIAKTADASGFSSLWLMDHFFGIEQGYGPVDSPMLEGYTTLPYLAAVTKKIKLGLMVTGAFYRPPGLLIKSVTTLDVLSGGRAVLGIGSGWYRREANGLGMPYPESKRARLGMLRETLQIAKKMWSDDSSPFKGKYYHLEEPINKPQPLSKPHPPILIGGGGEQVTLKLVARYADAVNLHLGAHPNLKGYTERSYDNYRTRIERLSHKMSVLREHCDRVDRNYDDIEITVLCPMNVSEDGLTPEEVLEMCSELAGIGIHHIIFNMSNDHEITPLETIGREVIPKLAHL
ncbi:MAG: LLM class F420-dependent oxidoreductase [Candidatus Bathyarchaeota archaeon]